MTDLAGGCLGDGAQRHRSLGHVVSRACAFHLTYRHWYWPGLLAEVVLPGLSREASPFYPNFFPHRHLEEGS